MGCRNYNAVLYLRLDKGDEVLSSILDVCEKVEEWKAFMFLVE